MILIIKQRNWIVIFSEIKNIVVSPGACVIQLHRNSLNPENIDSLTAQNNDVSPMQMNGNGLEFIGPNGFYSAITKGRVVGDLLEEVMLRLWKLMHWINSSLVSTTPGGSMTVNIGTDPPGSLFPNFRVHINIHRALFCLRTA